MAQNRTGKRYTCTKDKTNYYAELKEAEEKNKFAIGKMYG